MTSSAPFIFTRDVSARGASPVLTLMVSTSSGRGIASGSAMASSASSSRRSGSRSSNSRKTSRRFERSGVRVNSASRSMTTGTSVHRRQLLRHARVVGVLDQVLLALGAGDLVDRVEDRLEVAEALEQVGGGLVADAGDAGDVVGRVALEADEVGHQLGRDPVAVDHGLAVVDLRLGDAAARGHHPHAFGVDELKGVAVARDDRHRDPRSLACSAIVAITSSASKPSTLTLR